MGRANKKENCNSKQTLFAHWSRGMQVYKDERVGQMLFVFVCPFRVDPYVHYWQGRYFHAIRIDFDSITPIHSAKRSLRRTSRITKTSTIPQECRLNYVCNIHFT